MLWLILAALVGIIIILWAILKNLQILNDHQAKNAEAFSSIYGEIQDVKKNTSHKAGVTDPFKVANKTQTPGASSSHIIIRKSPDQIRAENFEKIKNGEGNYGHHS